MNKQDEEKNVLTEFVVDGCAVPWRAPAVYRGVAVKPKRVREWQNKVAIAASEAYSLDPYPGPVEVRLRFVKKRPKTKKESTWWTTTPDIDNLQKGVCDAIRGQAIKTGKNTPVQGVGRVIADDKQVVRIFAEKIYGERSEVFIKVIKIENDFNGNS